MGASPLPDAESLRKTVVSTAAALLIAFSPAVAPGQQAFAVESARAQELSPAEMLVQKTTDMQVRRHPHGGLVWITHALWLVISVVVCFWKCKCMQAFTAAENTSSEAVGCCDVHRHVLSMADTYFRHE